MKLPRTEDDGEMELRTISPDVKRHSERESERESDDLDNTKGAEGDDVIVKAILRKSSLEEIKKLVKLGK